MQLKNGSLRYSSQTFDLPASDSGLRMSSSRIAPPPPPATVIVSINNNVTCFEVEMVLENASIVRPGDQNEEGTNLRWASMGHRATPHWSAHLELMEVGRVCSIFRCLSFPLAVFVVSSDHDNHYDNQEAPITTRYLQSSASSSNLSHLGMASVADPRR